MVDAFPVRDDRLTLRLFNRGQFTPEDFEGGEQGLRLGTEAFLRYLGLYEEQLSSASEVPVEIERGPFGGLRHSMTY